MDKCCACQLAVMLVRRHGLNKTLIQSCMTVGHPLRSMGTEAIWDTKGDSVLVFITPDPKRMTVRDSTKLSSISSLGRMPLHCEVDLYHVSSDGIQTFQCTDGLDTSVFHVHCIWTSLFSESMSYSFTSSNIRKSAGSHC